MVTFQMFKGGGATTFEDFNWKMLSSPLNQIGLDRVDIIIETYDKA